MNGWITISFISYKYSMYKKKEEISAFDTLKRIADLEQENKELKAKVKLLRFDLLPKAEREWVENTYRMTHPSEDKLFLGNEWSVFKQDYMDWKDNDNKNLPF